MLLGAQGGSLIGDNKAMPRYTLINFEIKQCYQNEHQFNGVYSVSNLPNTVCDGVFEIHFDEHTKFRMHFLLMLY